MGNMKQAHSRFLQEKFGNVQWCGNLSNLRIKR